MLTNTNIEIFKVQSCSTEFYLIFYFFKYFFLKAVL